MVSQSSSSTGQFKWPFSGSTQSSTGSLASSGTSTSQTAIDGPGSLIYSSPVPLEGVRFRRLSDVLRFDVTKEWVYRNWARKSTGLADPELFGIRVPLVTGTSTSDLAGSLTYYFNSQGQVQHISFLGRTGDTTSLVNFLASTYKFQRVDSPAGESVYQVKRGSRAQSELRTRPESVLWSTSPHDSFHVELALERPGSSRTLPPRAPQLAVADVAASPVPAAPTEAAADSDEDDSSAGGVMSYLFPGKVRHATPEEERQILWQRWPD